MRVHGNGITSCPSLEWDGERWRCALVGPGMVETLAETYRRELFIGDGCCCSLNTDRQNIPTPQQLEIARKRERMSPDAREMLRVFEALLRALGRAWVGGDAKYLIVQDTATRLGLDDKAREEFVKRCLHVMSEESSSFVNEFMGGLPRF